MTGERQVLSRSLSLMVSSFFFRWRFRSFASGCPPPEKHDTVIKRLEQRIQTFQLFYTTSPDSRSRPSFSRSEALLPPFALQTFAYALQNLDVKTHFAPEGEADGILVSLANELEAYILGNDSDFLILISGPGAENVKGYCPLEFLEWIENPQSREKTDPNDWNVAGSSKLSTPVRQSPFLPSSNAVSPILVLPIVEAPNFRSRFRIPPPHYGLLASLIGNDYVPFAFSFDLFHPSVKGDHRIELVARTIRETLFGPSGIRERQANAGDQAVHLITTVIERLCKEANQYVNQATVQAMVDGVIDATLQYVLPSTLNCCSMGPFCDCEYDEPDSDDCSPSGQVKAARLAYAAARQRGYTSTVAHAYCAPDRIYLYSVLEDPSESSNMASNCGKQIRQAAWTMAEEALGDFRWPEADKEEPEEVIRDSEQSLDVKFEDALEAADDARDEGNSSEETTLVDENVDDGAVKLQPASDLTTPPRTLVEWIRLGTTSRLLGHQIRLPPRDADHLLTPIALRPLDVRLKAYLSHMSSDTPPVNALPRSLQPLVAALRTCIIDSAERSPAHSRGRWHRKEVEAVMKACLGICKGWMKDLKTYRPKRDSDEGQYPLLETRAAKIVAQLTAVMIHGHLLSQALLLVPNAKEPGESVDLTHLTPFVFLSGVAIHTALSGSDPPPSTGWLWSETDMRTHKVCVEAVVDGMDEHLIGWHAGATAPAVGDRSDASSDLGAGMGELDVDAEAKKGKKKRHGTGEKGSGTRFDLLNAITI